ncbi:MAG TPA: hypothetical protein VF595_03935 [Tepidisphaeraceae bacterium]
MSDAGIHAYDAGRVDPPHTHADPHGTGDPHAHGHNPHLAHHFDTMEQQYDSGKLGMWVFLATELLMFGGLFCAYAVYRANHPEVFLYAHHYLNTMWGAINTGILLASSLTMAWAVRCSQLNQTKALVILLLVTLLGGAGFMMIKAVEYEHKFHEHLAPGRYNRYNVEFKEPVSKPGDHGAQAGHAAGPTGMANPEGVKKEIADLKREAPTPAAPVGVATTPDKPYLFQDPNAGGADETKIPPRYTGNTGLSQAQTYGVPEEVIGHEMLSGHEPDTKQREGEGAGETHAGAMRYSDLGSALSQQRVNSFFGIYYCMTGLHGIHVLVGMGLIFWITYRAGDTKVKAWIPPLPILSLGLYLVFLWGISHQTAFVFTSIPFLAIGGIWLFMRLAAVAKIAPADIMPGEFSENFFAPVDLVGLYWHLVDLIWIFLFPLLYLIHGKVGS